MEVDGVLEVLEVAEASGCVLHPLDLGIDAFAGGICDPMLEVGEDVGQMALQFSIPAAFSKASFPSLYESQINPSAPMESTKPKPVSS